MDEPGSWVVGGKPHDQPAACREKRGIAARRVVEFETGLATIPYPGALTNHIVVWIDVSA
jgi:hypothetical protein